MFIEMEVTDYPDYLIFRNGSILGKKKRRFLKPSPNVVEGYMKVNLSKNGKARTFHIHRLLALHFIPNPNDLSTVDHVDRNKLNNNLSNLRWVTKTKNAHNRKIPKTNTSGYQYITPRKPAGFLFQICRYGKKRSKSFHSLQEAIEYKEKYFKDNPDF
tara:strand:+ start:207 stop:680 length:474 start_codon:yes stop_codon:yes gene_type:complete